MKIIYIREMNLRYYTAILSMFCVTIAFAQKEERTKIANNTVNIVDTTLVRSYTDSLRMSENLFSDTIRIANNDSYSDNKYFQMFSPFTFFHNSVDGLFRLNDSDNDMDKVRTEIDNKLMNMYLKRPDLIKNTQKRIHTAGKIDVEMEKPLKHKADFIDKMSPDLVESTIVPIDVIVMKPNFWTYKGDYSLQFMQNCVSGNWYKGGESSYSILGSLSMEANYNNKQKVKWDNKLELRLGVQNSRADTLHTIKSTEDLIRFTSKLGLQATKRWYYTVQMVANTQFIHSYKSNDPIVYSDFLAPLNLNLSIGMDYNVDWINHRIKGTVHLAPLAYNMKYTRLIELSERLGIDAGKHTLHDFGSQLTADLTWQMNDILRWKSRLSMYTAYDRAELEWENTFVMQINKWMSAQLFVYPRFDDGVASDGHHGYWQFKEFASIGFSYIF